MSKRTKIILSIIGGIIGVFVVAIIAIYAISSSKINKTYNVKAEEIKIPTEKASIERGKHLVEAVGKCIDCHGENLGGKVFVKDAMFGTIVAPNLTSGEKEEEEAKEKENHEMESDEFVLALRHGISHETNKSLILMPAQALSKFSNEDLGAIIAYVQSVPPVKKELPQTSLGPIARLLLVRGIADELLPASLVDHDTKAPVAPKEGVTKEYGKYLVETGGCPDCHKTNLGGGPVAIAPPGTPPAANLTPGGELKEWSLEDFTKMMREGKTESDRTLNSYMPWKFTKNLSDDEIEAMFLYLKSVPPVKGEEHEEEAHEE